MAMAIRIETSTIWDTTISCVDCQIGVTPTPDYMILVGALAKFGTNILPYQEPSRVR